jgi:acetyltransferase-like isoleucine patch superfamily enzyme
LEIGSYSFLGAQAFASNLTIGRFASVGPQLIACYGEHPARWMSTSPVFYSTKNQCGISFVENDLFIENKPSSIGHDAWVGARVYIRDGVRIGNGAIVAAGSTVARDIPDYAVVGGVPATIIRYRFNEAEIEALLELKWWDWSEERLRAARAFFIQEDLNGLLEWAAANSDNVSATGELSAPSSPEVIKDQRVNVAAL